MSDSVIETAESDRFGVTTISGIVFCITFVAGWMLNAPDSPETNAPLAEWQDWLSDDGHGTVAMLSTVLLLIASMAFVVFALTVAHRITLHEGSVSFASDVVKGFGVLAAGLLAAAGVAINTGPIQYLFEDTMPELIDVQVILQIQSLGYGFGLLAAAITMSALIAVASFALRSVTSTWYTVLGYGAAVVGLASVMFLPLIVFPIWVLIGAVVRR